MIAVFFRLPQRGPGALPELQQNRGRAGRARRARPGATGPEARGAWTAPEPSPRVPEPTGTPSPQIKRGNPPGVAAEASRARGCAGRGAPCRAPGEQRERARGSPWPGSGCRAERPPRCAAGRGSRSHRPPGCTGSSPAWRRAGGRLSPRPRRASRPAAPAPPSPGRRAGLRAPEPGRVLNERPRERAGPRPRRGAIGPKFPHVMRGAVEPPGPARPPRPDTGTGTAGAGGRDGES